MVGRGLATFTQHFEDLQDPRVERTRRHPLINVVFMAVCGVLSGANSIAGIHEFAIDRRGWLSRYLDLSHGIPSEDTLGRVPGLTHQISWGFGPVHSIDSRSSTPP